MNLPAPPPKLHWWCLWAVLCFVPTLFFHYVGEEGVYTLTSMEMWQRGEFRSTVMYGLTGGGAGRPPLFNWLMIPVAHMVGWEQVLLASRMVTVTATLGTGFITGWLAQQLWRDRSIAWMAALLYLLTADVLLYRGWLSYADPLFSMLVILSLAQTWVACLRRSYPLLGAAMLAAFAAFLTKALTAYFFLGVGMLVLLLDADCRRFLLKPQAWLIYVLALLPPLIWFSIGTQDTAQHHKMWTDVVGKVSFEDLTAYVTRLLVYPIDMFARLLPGSFFVAYFFLRRREVMVGQDPFVRQCLLLALLNFLPYWLAPFGGPRYVLPIYPFLALPAAFLVVRHPGNLRVRHWLAGMLTIGMLVHLLAFPYYKGVVRGENYLEMAQQIIEKYAQYPLYASNYSSVGLSVVANINSLQWDKPALVRPPADFQNGIVIAYTPDDVPGTLLRRLSNDNDAVYLICRGEACEVDN
jgi:4-amino-4-deoxy-L-arabinose transferase-like glycosyltransferase